MFTTNHKLKLHNFSTHLDITLFDQIFTLFIFLTIAAATK